MYKLKGITITLLISLFIYFSFFVNSNANTTQPEQPLPKFEVTCYTPDKTTVIYKEKVLSYTYIDGQLQVEKENNNAPLFIFGNCDVE